MKLAYIEELKNKKPIPNVCELALMAGYSREYFTRIFKMEFGISPSLFLTKLRLERAADLIFRKPEITAYELSKELNLSGDQGMYQFFIHHVNMSVGEFRTAVINSEQIIFENYTISQIR